MAMRHESILHHLRACRPSLLHAIDPFKVPFEQVVEKAVALNAYGFPAVILASTDWADFERVVGCCIDGIRAHAPDLPVLLHFPPRPGSGMPMVGRADATMYPFLLGSVDPYFVWRSYVETAEIAARHADERPASRSELLHLAALTFGTDERSRRVMALDPIVPTPGRLRALCDTIDTLGLEGAYLFSRYEAVPARVCGYFRRTLKPEQILFVSGGVRRPAQANAFFRAGADFVVFCGALECEHWRTVLDEMVSGCTIRLPGLARAAEMSR